MSSLSLLTIIINLSIYIITAERVTRHGSDFHCNGEKSCYFDVFNCLDGTCNIWCNGTNSCQTSIIYCPMNADCNLNCYAGYDACKEVIIFATHSLSLSIICDDYAEACDEQQIHCPNNGRGGPASCIINGVNNNNIRKGINIFAVEGINDISITGNALNGTKLYCTNDFSAYCILSDTIPFNQCVAGSNDKTCEQYLLPTSKPTISPTIHLTDSSSFNPTHSPIYVPTSNPIYTSSINPATSPTTDPNTLFSTKDPTINPTLYPTDYPSTMNTNTPTTDPTVVPTINPIYEYDYDSDSNRMSYYGSQFECNGDSSCYNDIINCMDNRPCNISCNGPNSCQYAIINCPVNAECDITCHGGYDACKYGIFFASHSNALLIDCGDVEEGCDAISVHCPNNNGFHDSLSCIVSGVNHKNVVYGMDIFAVKGFHDALVFGSELNNIHLYCKNDFSSQCIISNISQFKCINNDKICEEYLESTSKPTKQPTVLMTRTPTKEIDVIQYVIHNTTDIVVIDGKDNLAMNDDEETGGAIIRNICILIICILLILTLKYRRKTRHILRMCKTWNWRECTKWEISVKCKRCNIDKKSKNSDHQENIDKIKGVEVESICKLNNESNNLLISDENDYDGIHIEMTTFNVGK